MLGGTIVRKRFFVGSFCFFLCGIHLSGEA